MKQECIIEKNLEMIIRFARERGIEISEDSIIQNPYGGVGLSITHNGTVWLVETDEFNEKYILKHLNLSNNKKKKQSRYHEHLRSSYYDLIIQHIYTHHNNKERKVTKKNKESISLEQAFQRIAQENDRKLKLVK